VVSAGGDGGAGSDASSADGGGHHVGVDLPPTCPALTACGGTLIGTWDYRAACIDNVVSKLKGSCAAAAIQNPTGTVKGYVSFMGNNTVLRTLTSTVTATIVLPPSCTGGASCSVVQSRLSPSSVCTGTGGTCSCIVTNENSISDSDTYSLNGNTLVTGGGAQYDFCVSGNTLSYADRGAQPEYHGTFELAKR
jgi:hypothetical protein